MRSHAYEALFHGAATLRCSTKQTRHKTVRLLKATLLNSTIPSQNSTIAQRQRPKTVPAEKQSCQKTVLLQNSTLVDIDVYVF
jgi:hypothetical protein